VRQLAADLGLHENALCKWVRKVEAHREQAFPGQGRMRSDDSEVAGGSARHSSNTPGNVTAVRSGSDFECSTLTSGMASIDLERS
jgi:transposase-like protein